MKKDLLETIKTIEDECFDGFSEKIKNNTWAYENRLDLSWKVEIKDYDPRGQAGPIYRPLTKKEFVDKIKTDEEFAEKWGIKIEYKDLDFHERRKIFIDKFIKNNPLFSWTPQFGVDDMNNSGIPTKMTTLKFNNKELITVYE